MEDTAKPTREETVRLTVSMPSSVLAKLDDLCAEARPPKQRSRVIQELILSDVTEAETTE